MEKQSANRQLPPQELSLFCDQIAMVLQAGIPLYEALETLRDHYKGTAYGVRYNQIYEELVKNGSLYYALKSVGIFPKYLLGMVRVGEKTGRLDEIMVSLSRYYAREDRICSAIKSAVTYPSILVLMMAAVIAVLVIFVMPVFDQVYESLGADMSSASSAGAGIAIGNTVLIVIAVVIILLFFILIAIRTGARDKTISLIERLFPGVKQINSAIIASRFAAVFATMLKSGCDLNEAMEMSIAIATDKRSQLKLERCAHSLKGSGNFVKAVEDAGMFSPLHEKMIAVGSDSGTLDTVMARLASNYEEIADERIRKMISMIEPVLVALLCVAIGAILLSVILPLLSILSGLA